MPFTRRGEKIEYKLQFLSNFLSLVIVFYEITVCIFQVNFIHKFYVKFLDHDIGILAKSYGDCAENPNYPNKLPSQTWEPPIEVLIGDCSFIYVLKIRSLDCNEKRIKQKTSPRTIPKQCSY